MTLTPEGEHAIDADPGVPKSQWKSRPLRIEHSIEVPRTARYYTIGDDTPEVEELWFVLHGFSQLAGNFVQYFADLADGRRLVVAPEGLNRYYVVQDTSTPAADRRVGATWMTREDRLNEIRDYVRYLDLLHERIAGAHPHARTIVVGFSQGGATATRWLIEGRTLIDRLIVWGSVLPPDTDLSRGAALLRGARLTIAVGRTDEYVTPAAAAAEAARLTEAGIPFELIEFDGGHSIKRSVLATVAGRDL